MKIIKVANKNVSYTAIVSQESIAAGKVAPWQTLISKLNIPEGWTIHAHHMTMNMGACKDPSVLGETVDLKAVALGKDENVMAVLVESPIGTQNENPHVTVAVAPGAKPFWSNQLKHWKSITPFTLPGVVAEVAQGGALVPKDKIPGGLSDGSNPEDFDPKALAKGTKVEMEHTSDREIAKEIAMDHLTEDPKYYDKLETIEEH